MGCPKDYSIKGGMGAALLTEPEKVKKILSCLVNSLSVPVTCKIRILPKLQDTLALAKIIENTGVAAITVHARTPAERSGTRNHDEVIRAISETVSIPVIANGGSRETIRIFEDIEYFRQQTGASGVMVARAAMWNPAIFLNPACGRPLPTLHETVREYLTLAVRYDHHFTGTKYCIQQMLHREGDSTLFLQSVSSRSLEQLCSIWGLDEVYRQETAHRLERLSHMHSKRSAAESQDITLAPKRTCPSPTVADAEAIVSVDAIKRCVLYEHRFWVDQRESPKHLLFEYSKKHQLKPPEYRTVIDTVPHIRSIVKLEPFSSTDP
ncbi:unnamed protein product [Dicrocoelium dendriticum]|nr:unnamed protein product [Dicrocoelium dendriticum]